MSAATYLALLRSCPITTVFATATVVNTSIIAACLYTSNKLHATHTQYYMSGVQPPFRTVFDDGLSTAVFADCATIMEKYIKLFKRAGNRPFEETEYSAKLLAAHQLVTKKVAEHELQPMDAPVMGERSHTQYSFSQSDYNALFAKSP
jgi:hypothetical protein